jgi:hypothetical protein
MYKRDRRVFPARPDHRDIVALTASDAPVQNLLGEGPDSCDEHFGIWTASNDSRI